MNNRNLNDWELNEALIEARENHECWWKWYNSLSAEQIYSHYTRWHGRPIKQHYNKEVQQLPGVKQIIEERIEDEEQK
ncbi:hypothetical protein LCGC14_1205660 [marine sediment metagenome]|uniref:Uncharacterized protein n=1 Tax=marine sediment metagenome TaxID=412755 RepID=A0A0F9NXU9_9ZZZZ